MGAWGTSAVVTAGVGLHGRGCTSADVAVADARLGVLLLSAGALAASMGLDVLQNVGSYQQLCCLAQGFLAQEMSLGVEVTATTVSALTRQARGVEHCLPARARKGGQKSAW